MITTELKDISETERAEVEIYLDREGLDLLLKKLRILESKGGHVHFMTPAWAGKELSEEKVGTNNTLINHLCIIIKPD